MKPDLYTKIVLTVIAVLLAGILFNDRMVKNDPKDVRIVAIVKPQPEEIEAAIRESSKNIWSTLPIDGDVNVSGSVDVDNTVDVDGEVSIVQ